MFGLFLRGAHPKHVGFGDPVAGFQRYEGDGVVECTLEQTGAKGSATGDVVRNDHAGADVRRMVRVLEEFVVIGPE